ncbi:MAG: DNA topoisomerase 4 subunit A, partial [Actinomycetota bacterium]|nr:DNA topoisomerase 4 subunit A [Actinomycetota bacterium]
MPDTSEGETTGGSVGQESLLEDAERVVDVDIVERIEQAFLDYSMSVIVGRALPDVRDGLKPVQRRILHAMWEAGLRPGRPYRKCAAVVGDVMKKYHPHGDASIYDALVRMAQDFSMREPLVDGHGNFGSVDGDAAAALRYTEARLSPIAMELLAGLDEDTVQFVPNYDGYESEPTVLPARFPSLLVNGASGIAVGMATNVPPHNLGELVDACLHLLSRPQSSVDELMRIVPAPDFPTGARIVPSPGIRDAYLTGRGAVTVEAVASAETRAGGVPRLVVTEIPFQVNKATLLERIAELVKAKKVDEIRDLRDESSRDGMRIVIELKRGEDPASVLGKLYRLCDLRANFNVNLVALVDGQPRTLGLKDCLQAYLCHQRDVLTRRTVHRRDRAAARAHVVQGLLVALDHLDAVIALIRGSDTVEDARAELTARYQLSETQATAVLDLQLRRLAALERRRLADEQRELVGLIAELQAILDDPARLDALLAQELGQLRSRHANPRRSRVGQAGQSGRQVSAEAAPPGLDPQPVTVHVTARGYLRAVPRRRVPKPHPHPRDPLVAAVRARTDDALLLIDVQGGGYRVDLGDLPVTTVGRRGTAVEHLLGDAPGAPLVGAVRLDPSGHTVLTVSAAGLVKRTDASQYQGRARVMTAAGVKDGDELVAALGCNDDDHLLVAHDGGRVIRFPAADVRPTGRGAAGVASLQVPAGRRVVCLSAVPGGGDSDVEVLTVARDGRAKRA